MNNLTKVTREITDDILRGKIETIVSYTFLLAISFS